MVRSAAYDIGCVSTYLVLHLQLAILCQFRENNVDDVITGSWESGFICGDVGSVSVATNSNNVPRP